MQRIFNLTIAAVLMFASCEKEPLNPGDFSLKPSMQIEQISDTSGVSYPFTIRLTSDTTYASGKQGTYIQLDTIVLEAHRTELAIRISTNARWLAPLPDFQGRIAWLQTQTSAGGGDGIIRARLSPGLANARRPILANQFIYTRDSLIMYHLVFDQKSRNE
jgi:hypothetical protein